MKRRGWSLFFIVFLLVWPVVLSAGGKGHPPDVSVRARLLLDRDYFTTLLDAIDEARDEIVFCSYLFKTIAGARGYPEQVIDRLKAASRRGVRVRFVMELNREDGDLVRTNEQTARTLRDLGMDVVPDPQDRVTHAKLIVFDRKRLLAGSHNLTQAALGYNHEVSLLLESPELAEEALRYIDALQNNNRPPKRAGEGK